MIRVTILGCGGSDGVPLIGGPDGLGEWGACDPANPKNRRTRSSVLVEAGGEAILIDTGPDLRTQLLATGKSQVTATLITHEHADHTHGVHELRRLSILAGQTMPVFASPSTANALETRFGYAFLPESDSPYEPIAELRRITGAFNVGPVKIQPFEQDHGFGATTTGFRIGPVAYTTDAARLPDAAFEVLKGVRLWIVDCVQEAPHPTHANVETALGWIERVRPERAVLTHLGPSLDYAALSALCPPGVEPAYDGLQITL